MEVRETTRIAPIVQVRQEKDDSSLRYRMRTLWLLAFYVPLITIPWVLTCVLATRPINGSSYVKQQGFTATEVKNLRNWKTAVDVLNSIVALITIPFLSAMLAQAAVVFCQKRHAGQFLSLRDMFVLADRGWTNPAEVWRSIRLSMKRKDIKTKTSGPFLLLAAALITIGAIQQPLYQILVRMDTIAVTSCSDTRFRYNTKDDTYCQDGSSANCRPIGVDIEPAQMAQIFHNTFLPRVASDLAAIGLDEEQNNIWSDTMPGMSWYRAELEPYGGKYKSLRSWLPSFNYDDNSPDPTFFVANLQTNSTTGVLRELSMRFNSSIQCKEIDKSLFPSPCPGENPFVTRLQKSGDTDIRVCAPGNIGTFPWKLSRNRQEITEELYLDLWDGDLSTYEDVSFKNISATIRCEAKTTRGYFELGNTLNNDTYGPLLDQWPSPEQMQDDFNDFVETDRYNHSGFIPTERRGGLVLLDASALAMVENVWTADHLRHRDVWQYFMAAQCHKIQHQYHLYKDRNYQDKVDWDRLCAGMPYKGLFGGYSEGFPSPAQSCKGIEDSISAGYRPNQMTVLRIIHEWLEAFAPARYGGELTDAISLLQISVYVVNRALLTFYSPNVVRAGWSPHRSQDRVINASPGQAIQKPVLSTAAVVVLSLLIGLQLIGLAFLAYYIYRVPTWTGAFDAMAIARIGASVRQHDVLPPIGPVKQTDREALQNVDGLVGIDYSHDDLNTSRLTLVPDQQSETHLCNFERHPIGSKEPYLTVEQKRFCRSTWSWCGGSHHVKQWVTAPWETAEGREQYSGIIRIM